MTFAMRGGFHRFQARVSLKSDPHGNKLATVPVASQGPQRFEARYKDKKQKGRKSAPRENITPALWRDP